ncbi:hypothetical protein ACFQHN_03120 [Natrialbaceae archaeon GCM10025896]
MSVLEPGLDARRRTVEDVDGACGRVRRPAAIREAGDREAGDARGR